jgi:hypothetical protein
MIIDSPIQANVDNYSDELPENQEISRDSDGMTQDYLTERDLAVAAAIYYQRRNQSTFQIVPERLNTGWHRNSRRFPV